MTLLIRADISSGMIKFISDNLPVGTVYRLLAEPQKYQRVMNFKRPETYIQVQKLTSECRLMENRELGIPRRTTSLNESVCCKQYVFAPIRARLSLSLFS